MKFQMFRQLSRIAFARTALACACAITYAAVALAEAPAAAAAPTASGQPSSAQPSSGWIDPINAPAESLPLASRSLLLDVARSGERYVAVGARGNILLSDDGRAWRQSAVPTRTTFTAVTTIDAQIWAVGHDGVIAHSADGGAHWELQRQDPWKAPVAGDSAAPDPHQGAPLLGVLFLDVHRGYAVGAYSLALKTDDGGATWQVLTVAKAQASADAGDELGASEKNSAKNDHSDKLTFSKDELKLGQEATPHFNAIARTGSGALLIVGERGSAFRSRDEGASWQRLQLPYDGSMFGVIGYEADHVLAFGLRGHVYESTDLGDHWTQVATGTELSLMGGAALPDGGTSIVGANGIVLMRTKAGEPLKSYVDESAGIIASVLPLANGGGLLIAGENGVRLFQPH